MLRRTFPNLTHFAFGMAVAVVFGGVGSDPALAAQRDAADVTAEKSSDADATSTRADSPPSEDLSYRKLYPPKYPKAAIDAHRSGRLLLVVLIDKRGEVESVRIEKATPPEAEAVFGESAIAAVKQWKFSPGFKNGKPYEGFALVPLDFSLDP
jgi:TonB family protein